MTITTDTQPRTLVLGLEQLAASVASLASQLATTLPVVAERAAAAEAQRIRAGAHSRHLARALALLPASHPARAAVAALAHAQRDNVPASLTSTPSRRLNRLHADELTRTLLALLTARDLGEVVQPLAARERCTAISPRAPAPARLA